MLALSLGITLQSRCRVVTRLECSEYREVGGVKIPSKWTMMWLGGRSKYELTLMQPNVAIDAGRFARPAPPAPRQ